MKKSSELLKRISYASGDIYGGGSFLIVGLLLLSYLTKVEGMSGTMAGIVIFIGKAWDAVTDPFMGILSDRTTSPKGRRRLYFLLGALPVFLSWVMLWYSFGIVGEAAKFIYYTFAVMFFSTAFTIVMVPYNALLADMVQDYNKRSAYTGMRLSFSAGSAILCGILPGMITGSYADPKTGYLVMALLFGVVFALSWIAVYFGTWENTKGQEKAGFSYRQFFSVFRNRSFRQYALIFVCSQIAIDVAMALAVFYLGVSLRKEYLFVPSMAAILVVQLLCIVAFSVLAQKTNKKLPGIVAAAVWIVANVLIFTFSPQTPDALVVCVCALIGVGGAGCNLVAWTILPDISDVDELMTGKRREGLYAGVSTFLRKLSGGIAVGAVGLLLDVFRYSEQAVRQGVIEPITTMGVKLLFCLIPTVFLLAMLLALRHYRLGKKEFGVMQDVLSSFRQGQGSGSVVELSGEQAAVCETLTGIQAQYLFGAQREE